MPYAYPMREVIADGTVHVLGLVAAVIAAILLIVHLGEFGSGPTFAGVSIYAGFLLFALVASAAYHLLPWERSRPLLHKIDHAAIYLKIAGTYTPLVVMVGSAFSYVVLGAGWLIALIGAWARLRFWSPSTGRSLPLYLGLGWASLLLVYPMALVLPLWSMILIGVGGLLYTVGAVLYTFKRLRFENAIWHSFVLTASACFFSAIALAATAEIAAF